VLSLSLYIYIYIYITRLATNEIFSPSNKIRREVGRANDLSARRYTDSYQQEARKLLSYKAGHTAAYRENICALMKEFCLGFRREVNKNCALLGHYAASSGNSLPTFRNNLSVPSSRH
jgi:hypothetical protein